MFEALGTTLSWDFKLSQRDIDDRKNFTSGVFHLVNLNPEQEGYTTAWWLRWKSDERTLTTPLTIHYSRIALNERSIYGPTFGCIIPLPIRGDGIVFSASIVIVEQDGSTGIDTETPFFQDGRNQGSSTMFTIANYVLATVKSRVPAKVQFRLRVHAGARIENSLLSSRNVEIEHALEGQWKDLHNKQHPWDVCFIFVDDDVQEAIRKTLWENSTHLASVSTYWESLTRSGFAESVEKQTNEGCESSYIVLKIEKTAGRDTYEAYRSILNWTRTKRIKFGALQDSNELFEPVRPEDEDMIDEGPTEIDPICDPLTVYEISKYIQLEELASIALQELRTKLTVDNVLAQLFSSTLAWKYEEFKSELLQFCAHDRNRTNLKLLKNLQAMRSRVEADELPISAGLAASLMMDIAISMLK